MATRNSNGVEQRRARLDGNRPRTHLKHFGCNAGDALDRHSRARAGWPTTDTHTDRQENQVGDAP